MKSAVKDFSVKPQTTELPNANQDEFYVDYPNFTTYYGYYRKIPELKKAIDALALWVMGKGYECDGGTMTKLQRISGCGKDVFDTIVFNQQVMTLVNGDAFCQIIRHPDSGDVINLKPLSPERMRTVFDPQGRILRYEQVSAANKAHAIKKFQPSEIWHSMGDRVADEPRGTSVVEACQWVIDARNEAMSDKRRVHHRSTIRIMEVDSDDTTKLAALKLQYQEAIKNGEVLIVPKGNVGFPDAPINYIDTLEWIQYLENAFYAAVGVPKVIATSENFTEASSKMAVFTFDPVYIRHQKQRELELWNQAGILIAFNRQPDLMGNVVGDEERNTGQMGMQQNDVTMHSGAT